MRTTCSAITPRSSACALLELGWSCWATSSFTDLTMMSSMSVAGMRETDPTDTVLDSPLRCGSEGECFCGTVKIEVSGDPEGMGYCHCQSCRQWSGGPVNAFSLWKPEA